MEQVVTYRPGFLETSRALRAIGYSQPWLRWLRRTGWGAILVAFLLLIFSAASDEIVAALLGLAVLILLLLWTLPYLWAWMVRRDSPVWTGEQSVSFDPRGITSDAGGARAHLSWADVTRVVETKRFFLVFTSAGCACHIPKHALSAAGAIDRFRFLASEHAGTEARYGAREFVAEHYIGPERFSASYRWSVRELYAASMAVARHGSRQWPLLLSMIALVGWIGGPTAYQQYQIGGWHGIDWPFVLLAACPLLIFLGAKPVAAFFYAHSHTRWSKIAQQEQRVHVGEDGVAGEGAMSSTGVRWEGVVKAVETQQYFLFYLNKVSGLVLPKRVLAEDVVAELRAFLEMKLANKFVVKSR